MKVSKEVISERLIELGKSHILPGSDYSDFDVTRSVEEQVPDAYEHYMADKGNFISVYINHIYNDTLDNRVWDEGSANNTCMGRISIK